jgi:hypothetical protein
VLSIRFFFWAALAALPASAEPWQEALARMPLQTGVRELNRTNCVQLMLAAFQSNNVLKALIFMPGATDEFYMFRRAKAQLTNASPSLLDAVSALTNQTLIRATIRGPFLLLHSDEDPLEPLIRIEHQPTMEKLTKRRFLPHALFNDRDWEFLYPLLRKQLKTDIQPWRYSYDSWHFYRASLAAWNLSGPETLEVIALACKAAVTVRWKQLLFEPDMRFQTLNPQKPKSSEAEAR